MILEAFEKYCSKKGITSEQYKEDIFPVFAAGFTEGRKADRQVITDQCFQPRLTRRGNPA